MIFCLTEYVQSGQQEEKEVESSNIGHRILCKDRVVLVY